MRYVVAMLLGAMFGLFGCAWEQVKDESETVYTGLAASAKPGQTAAELKASLGAPNQINQLDNGLSEWVYFTTYQPVNGGGEVIRYNTPVEVSSPSAGGRAAHMVSGRMSNFGYPSTTQSSWSGYKSQGKQLVCTTKIVLKNNVVQSAKSECQ